MEMDMDSDEDEMEMDMEMDSDDDDMDSDVLDLTNASPEEVAKVFKKLGPNDKIEVVKDGDYLHIDDTEGDSEFLIDMRESDESMEEMEEDFDMEMDYEEESDDDDLLDKLFTEIEEEDGIMYEIEMEDDDMMDMEMGMDDDEMEMDDIMYEIEMEDEDMEEEESYMNESKKMKGTIKPVVGKKATTGTPKFSYEKSKDNSFAKGKSSGKPTYKVGGGAKLGKAKFEFKEGSLEGAVRKEISPFKKEESKEASRTFGMGSKKGRGLRKGITPNRNLTFPIKENQELEVLRQKNEEYRRALNIFRDKLNEVAVFNSNLAYATRLFTEHSTTKQEKINILKRFDSVETLKESKSVYKTIKDELSSKNSGSNINESIENKIDKSISTGSAVNLMESKTYENPQFLRMKDIMSKIIK
jgi:hypothetical protein